MNPSIPTRLACALALFFLVATCDANGQEQSFPSGNCAFTPPPGWSRREFKQLPDLIAAYSDPAGDRTLMILANQRGKVGPAMDEAAITEVDRVIEKDGGGPKTSGKLVQFAGFRAYERRGTAGNKNKHMTTLGITFPTGDGIYILHAFSTVNEAADDEEMRRALNSFRFRSSPGTPRQPPDAAYRAGYFAGQGFVSLPVLALIIWGVSKLVSRRKSTVLAGPSGSYPSPLAGFAPMHPTGVAEPPPLPPGADGMTPKRYEY